MRILANENLPRVAVAALRARGHDVNWVRTSAPGASDREVLKAAITEARLLVTFDKDFGELVFREGISGSHSIVLLRITLTSPSQLANAIVRAMESRTDWAGHFSVIEDDRIRMVPLPSTRCGD